MDVSYLPRKVVEAAIARLYPGYDFGGVNLLEEGIDIREDPFEVAPGCHFFMGGIVADEWGETGLPGLLACGEVVGGVHGANRLGGSALPEMSVFGRRAGMRAAEYAKTRSNFVEPSKAQVRDIRNRRYGIHSKASGLRPLSVREEIQKIMYDNVLTLRDEGTLTAALRQLEAIRSEKLPQLALSNHTRRYNLEWLEALEAEFMVDVAEMIIRAALMRRESRGAHYRADFPSEDNEHGLVNLIICQESGEMKISPRPVAFTKVSLEAAREMKGRQFDE
jgi:fumarate reductase (CoM/CoB) subunit A